MTDSEFKTVLATMAEKIQSQELTIACQKYEIDDLKAKLEKKEKKEN